MTKLALRQAGRMAYASLERSMTRYTLFFLDWDDATVGNMDIECVDDETALLAAAENKGDHVDVEVLCGNRIVGRPPSR